MRGNNRLNLTSQYQPYIPDKCHTVITVFKLFHNQEARLWKCYHVTMNSSYFLLLAKLTQLWCNVVIPTSRRGCEFDAAVTMLYWCCHCNIYYMLWGEFTIQCWGQRWYNVVNWRHSISFVKTLWVWRHDVNIATTLSIQRS